jgi:uncharacterized membrane protein (DUF485 family)
MNKRNPHLIDWENIAQSPEFQKLMGRKKRFLVSATVFFLLYYFALPISAGFSHFLNTRVFGAMNFAYLFALSQFLMAWVLAFLYVRHANRMDQLVEEIIRKQGRKVS